MRKLLLSFLVVFGLSPSAFAFGTLVSAEKSRSPSSDGRRGSGHTGRPGCPHPPEPILTRTPGSRT